MTTRTLYLDLDGVFADFDQAVINATGKMPHQLGTIEQMWESLPKEGFFEKMPPTWFCDWFYDAVRKVAKNKGWKVKILTAIPMRKSYPNAKVEKTAWVRKHLGRVPVVFGPYSKDKWKHAKPGDILLDDRKQNVLDWLEKPEFTTYAVFFQKDGFHPALRRILELPAS